MSSLPAPVISEHDGILVVRDDLILGGTKRRVLPTLFGSQHAEYVYASPCQGYAQVALAYAAAEYDKKATIFCAKRGVLHRNTAQAIAAGGNVREITPGYLSCVRKRAKDYAHAHGAKLLPFGLDTSGIRKGLATLARGLRVTPAEVWTVAGSGTLTRALQEAWPDARFYAVRVGAVPQHGRATLLTAPEPFEQDAKEPPPFPSCGNYDAKAWRFIRRQASRGALFWNVAG